MNKQISDQVKLPTSTENKDPKDVLGPETTEPSAFSRSDTEPVEEDKKNSA